MAKSNRSPETKTARSFRRKGPRSETNFQQTLEENLRLFQLIQEREKRFQGKSDVTVTVSHNRPIDVITQGDFHVGHFATDHRAIIALRDYILSSPDRAIVLLGDLAEGIKQAYLDTNVSKTIFNFQQQIEWLRKNFLIPLAQAGRILAIVGGHFGHDGWGSEATTLNPWRMQVEGLDIPILQNGGNLHLEYKNGHTQTINCRHNPSKTSVHQATYGGEMLAQTAEEGHVDAFVNAHTHKLEVAEYYLPGATESVVMESGGTPKGSNPDLPRDEFGEKIGLPLADPMGTSIITQTRKRGQRNKRRYPVPSFKHGEIVFDSVQLLDAVTRLGMVNEFLERIYAEVEAKPELKFMAELSKTQRVPYGNGERKKKANDGKESKYAPLYNNVVYDAQTRLPITVHIFQNGRAGATYEGLDSIQKYLEDIVNPNPHAFAIWLRNMVDREVVEIPNRQAQLDRYANLINQTRSLVLMQDANFRQKKWKKSLGEESPPVAPGSYLSKKTDVPLVHHRSTIVIGVGPSTDVSEKPLYTGSLNDKLDGHGSKTRVTFGLRREYDLHSRKKPGFTNGGHMPGSGFNTFFDRNNRETNYPTLIAGGWWADFVDTIGQGNESPGAEPGQAIILLPGKNKSDYLALPTAGIDESNYLPTALTLFIGLGILDKEIEPGLITSIFSNYR